jgi:hypothetical protein
MPEVEYVYSKTEEEPKKSHKKFIIIPIVIVALILAYFIYNNNFFLKTNSTQPNAGNEQLLTQNSSENTSQSICQPKTCEDLGYNCGNWSDGCNDTINCGTCSDDQNCNKGNCSSTPCQPNSCSDLGYNCGNWDDGCGGKVNCGSCSENYTCQSGTCTIIIVQTPNSSEGNGLKVGDWVNYSVIEFGVANPQDFIKTEVTGISGNNVTESITHYYQDGTTNTETRSVDISTGSDFVTSANLNVGDSRTGAPPVGTITVSQILTRSYGEMNREVAYSNQTGESKPLQIYYDRKTGFLLEEYYGSESVLSALTLNSTNLW